MQIRKRLGGCLPSRVVIYRCECVRVCAHTRVHTHTDNSPSHLRAQGVTKTIQGDGDEAEPLPGA